MEKWNQCQNRIEDVEAAKDCDQLADAKRYLNKVLQAVGL